MNIYWGYILSTYIKIYHEGYISRIFVRKTYTISKLFFRCYMKTPQLLTKETSCLPHYLTLQNVSGGELYMSDSVTVNNKTYTLVSFTEYKLVSFKLDKICYGNVLILIYYHLNSLVYSHFWRN